MGCFAGCIAYFIRGMWFSPKKERFYGGVLLLKRRAPVLGGMKLNFYKNLIR
jgi:import inner membrane translocase subunit TIM17